MKINPIYVIKYNITTFSNYYYLRYIDTPVNIMSLALLGY